jgi:glycosyltransferase involved in cell wall biosynthesis
MKIIEVGKMPPPQGGISTHLQRLSTRIKELEESSLHVLFCDLASVKSLLSFDIDTCNWNFYRLFKMLPSRGENCCFHVHASAGNNLFILANVILFMFPKARFWVTFHHGALESAWSKLSSKKISQLRSILEKSNKIICVSDKQVPALLSNGVLREKIAICSSYIQPVKSPRKVTENHLFKIGSSGYGQSYYQFELVINAVSRIQLKYPDVSLEIILYGSVDPDTARQLNHLERKYSWLAVLPACSSESFQTWLASLSMYVRMTLVDSFGLALAEAHEVGTPTIASDICKRPPGTILVPPDSIEILIEKMSELLEHPKRIDYDTPDGFDELKKLYMELLDE